MLHLGCAITSRFGDRFFKKKLISALSNNTLFGNQEKICFDNIFYYSIVRFSGRCRVTYQFGKKERTRSAGAQQKGVFKNLARFTE